MTDLRKVTIIGMMGRLITLIDEGRSGPSPVEVKQSIAEGTILDRLCSMYGEYPEFSPIHQAEKVLLVRELNMVREIYDGREEFKMGVRNSGLCLLMAYCIEMLMQRSVGEIVG